jgi:pyruvate dehydrogenase E2 component (dihydrolipoamide acetyltransferase)
MSSVKTFALPDLGEGLTEGEILKWLVSVGDTVELNQPIVEVETAKAAVEIPAKWAGRVEAIFHGEGETVEVGTPIIAIETDPTGTERTTAPAGSAGKVPAAAGAAAGGGPAAGGAGDAAERTAVLVGYGPRPGSVKRRPRRSTPPAEAAGSRTSAQPPETVAFAPVNGGNGKEVNGGSGTGARPAGSAGAIGNAVVLAKPPVRKLARDLGVDLRTITGTGPQGSITRDDVHAAVAAAQSAAATAAAPAFGPDREQRIPIRGVRKLTAENMVASAFTAPHVTEFLTVDMTRSMRALDRLQAQPGWQEVRLSPLLLVAKAALLAIRRHPMINSTWSDGTGEIVVKEYVNLGIAAATERGLIVPNIKDAGRLTLRELADAMTALVQTAKAGRTPPADMSGGTFTITNVGVFGVDAGTPILPPGEAAILAFGAVREAPWVHRGKVKVRQVTTLSLSFDHRIIDGELGSRFLRDVGQFLTDPEAALLAWC